MTSFSQFHCPNLYRPPPPPPRNTLSLSLSKYILPSVSLLISCFFLSAMVPQAIMECECGATYKHFIQGLQKHMEIYNHRPAITRRFAKQWPEFNPANKNPALSEDKFRLVLNLGKRAVSILGDFSLGLCFDILVFPLRLRKSATMQNFHEKYRFGPSDAIVLMKVMSCRTYESTVNRSLGVEEFHQKNQRSSLTRKNKENPQRNKRFFLS